MPLVSVHPDATMQPKLQQQAPRPPLRRAVYIHVSDLTSAYNIDHKRLEQELARVKVCIDTSPSTKSSPPLTDEASVTSMPQKRLSPPRSGFNLCVLVGKVNIVVDKLRVDRSRVRLAEVEVGDETGTVSLRARDEQIDILEEVSQVSGAVILRNCTLELFQGKHIRLAVTKWGKMSVFPDDVASTPPPPSKVNRERNFSLIDLSIVASEMVENQPPEGGHLGPNREIPTEHSRGAQNRPPFQLPQYQRPQPQRRSPRDRRQSRPGRGVGANPLVVPFPQTAPSNQMRAYPHLPGYCYGESMDMQHYSYGASRPNQESMQPTAQQFLQLQQQQYEMQRRQMQQMHAFHEQGDRNRQLLRQMQTNLGLSPSSGLGSSSFDSGPPEFPSLPGIAPMHAGNRPRKERSRNSPREGATTSPPTPDMGPWGGQHQFDHGMDDSIGNSPRMNPKAIVFAPSYGSPPGPGPPMQTSPYQQGYNPYDQRGSFQLQRPQQHTVYAQNIIYVPIPAGTSGPVAPLSANAPDQTSDDNKASGSQTKGSHA